MKKTEIKYGFSLMEMMVVMLVLSVVAAVTAPMVNKKMIDDSKNQSYFVPTGTDNSLVFNGNGSNSSFIIGDSKKDGDSRLQITTEDSIPHILLRYKKNNHVENPTKILATNSSILLTKKDNKQIPSDSVIIDNNIDDSAFTEYASGMIAIGRKTKPASNSIAIGREAVAGNGGAIAIGSHYTHTPDSKTNESYSAAKASSKDSIAIGTTSYAGDVKAIAIGVGTKATASSSIALGGAAAEGEKSIALGDQAKVKGLNSIAIGIEAEILPVNSNDNINQNIAIGYKAKANDGNNSLAIGNKTQANAESTIAIGNRTITNAKNAIAIGTSDSDSDDDPYTVARGNGSIAIGQNAVANLSDAIAIGPITRANGTNSVAIGYKAEAAQANSTAIGYNAKTFKNNQIVLGNKDTTVYIPGRLIVANDAVFALNEGYTYVSNPNIRGNAILGGTAETTAGVAYIKKTSNGDYQGGDSEAALQYKLEKTQASMLNNYKDHYKTLSDRRLKNVGKPFSAGLAEIKKLEVFNYTFKKDESKTPRVGVMAQDLQKIFPNAVTKGDDGFLRIRMEDMFYTMVNAIKELAAKFDLTDKKVAELEKQNKEILEQNAELKEQNKALADTIAELDKRLKKLEKAK